MKQLFFIAIVALSMLNSCGLGFGVDELKMKNDSLFMAGAEKDRKFNELIESIVEIDANLAVIKEKENIIALNSNEAQNNKGLTDQINEDIKLIYELMVQNQQKIEQLQKQLRNANFDSANMKKLIASLNEQLVVKNAEISALSQQLRLKNIEIEDLNYKVSGLNESIDSMQVANNRTATKLDVTTVKLFKGYYAIGTSKDLVGRGIINKDGFMKMKKTVLNKQIDNSNFKEVDIREIGEIPTECAKIKILTTHPEKSFKLKMNSDGLITIEIINFDSFWSISKYLVIQSY